MDAEKDKLLSNEYIKIPQILTKTTSDNTNSGISTLASCTSSCESSCQKNCEYYCQTSCQLYWQTSPCSTSCEVTCQIACEHSCEVGCQVSNQGCSSTCEKACQTGCESSCQANCQKNYMGDCTNCESCLTQCQLCLGNRQDGCEIACMTGCEELCESTQTCSCQYCQSCQDSCEKCESCQSLCETSACCQATCQSYCQAACEWTGETACQTGCQDNCQAGACQTNNELIWGGSQTTKPTVTGSLTVIAIGTDYITVSLSKIDKATYYQIAYRLSSTSTTTIIDSNELTVTITGLTPNTEYVVNYRGANNKGAGPFMSQGVTVKTRPIGVWEWYSDIAKGLPMGCLVCEIASEHTNGIKVIPAYEWRDFCNAINDVRRLKKLSSYYFTNPVDGAQFTASVFNEAVSAIQEMNSAVSSVRVTSGSEILASSFLDIRDRLNECV